MKRTLITILVVLVVAPAVVAQESQGLTAFERAQQEAQVLRQRTLAKVGSLLTAAEKATAAERFVDADLALREAASMINRSESLTSEERTRLTLELKRVSELYDTGRAEYLRVREERAAKEMAARDAARRAAEKQFSARQLEAHWARLREFRNLREYDQALAEARSILQANPNDERAQRETLELEVLRDLAASVGIRQDRGVEGRKVLGDVAASAIPYYDLYRYPDARTWQELTERRLTELARQLGYTTTGLATKLNLGKRVDLKMTEGPLSGAVSYLSEATGVPIIADPQLKTDTGSSLEEVTITAQFTHLTLEQILNMILPEKLGWRVDEDHIVISSREKANPLKILIYPIQHMVAQIPDYGKTAPRMMLGDVLSQGGQGGQGGAQQLFQPAQATTEETTAPEKKIIELIQRFVTNADPRVAAWESAGGPATIEYFNGNLIVSQTEAGHRKVVELLARL